MKMIYKKNLIMAFALVILLSLISSIVLTVTTSNIAYATTEEKIICKATIDDDFCDNEIMMVISNMVSRSDKIYSIEDFSDIGCVEVVDITANLPLSQNFNVSKFNRILNIKLLQHSKQNVLDKIKILETRDDIILAEPNYYATIYEEETNEELITNAWWQNSIGLTSAWNISSGSNDIKVGVIDTGIQANHPAFLGRINTGLSRYFPNEETGDPLIDTNGHGTFVAGVIGGQNADVDLRGVCSNVNIVSLRVKSFIDENNYTQLDTNGICQAIIYAQSNEIPIVNLSAGYYGETYANTFALAVNQYEGLLVCAAGNSGKNIDDETYSQPVYPACLNNANIIVVGNSNTDNTFHSSSNYGPFSVDLFAPGVNICGPSHLGGYINGTGTSFSAPIVAGIAVLVKAHNPNMTIAQIKERILSTVTVTGTLGNECVTGGIVNALNAVHGNEHIYTYISIGASSHRKMCTICGYTIEESHDLRYTLKRTYCLFCDYDIDLLGPPIDIRPDKKDDDGDCC